MDVALHGRKNNLALRFDHLPGGLERGFLRFHERSQIGHRFLHHTCRFDHLWQEHLPRSKQVAYHAHAIHQRTFDHQQRPTQLGAGFLGVDVDERVNAPHQRVRQAFLNRPVAPFFGLFLGNRNAGIGRLQRFAVFHQPLGRIGTAVQQHVLHHHPQLRLDLLIHLEHAGVDDSHVHAGRDRMIEERRVHRLADLIISPETERNVGNAAAHLGMRQVRFNPPRGIDKVHRVVVVLLHAGRDGKDVGVENDVLGREPDLVHQNPIGALADADLLVKRSRLPVFVERHHYHRRAVFQHFGGVLAELLLAFLERNRVDDSLPLQALQSRLDHFPLRRVHHEGHLGDFRLTAQQLQEPRHRGDAVNHPLVHADVDHVRAVFHLLPRDADRFLVVAFLDELCELR